MNTSCNLYTRENEAKVRESAGEGKNRSLLELAFPQSSEGPGLEARLSVPFLLQHLFLSVPRPSQQCSLPGLELIPRPLHPSSTLVNFAFRLLSSLCKSQHWQSGSRWEKAFGD